MNKVYLVIKNSGTDFMDLFSEYDEILEAFDTEKKAELYKEWIEANNKEEIDESTGDWLKYYIKEMEVK